MRDAIGSTIMVTIIIAFIVIVSSYLAYNVNYTKAFRMKNKIISIYEDYKGNCTSQCETEIFNYSRDLGYNPAELNCSSTYVKRPSGNPLYCERRITVNTVADDPDNKVVGDKIGTHYYNIVTRINISIPLFDNIFNFGFLYVAGDTKLF